MQTKPLFSVGKDVNNAYFREVFRNQCIEFLQFG